MSKMVLRKGILMERFQICFALQCEYFEHNSLGFENLLMGLYGLGSLFRALSVSCYEFSHLKCREFMKQV